MFLGVFFPSYKDYQIINVLVNYVVLPVRVKEFEAMKDNLEGYLIERLNKTAIASPYVLNQARSQIIDKFRHGWLLALDAFTSVTIEQVGKENQAARVRFHDALLQATEHASQEETPTEKIEREKWEKSADELTSLAEQALGEVGAEITRRENKKELQNSFLKFMLNVETNKPLRGQVLAWLKEEQISLTGNDTEKLINGAKELLSTQELQRRAQTEMSIQKFLLHIDAHKPLLDQVLSWIKKEKLALSDKEIEKFVDVALSKYKGLQSQ